MPVNVFEPGPRVIAAAPASTYATPVVSEMVASTTKLESRAIGSGRTDTENEGGDAVVKKLTAPRLATVAVALFVPEVDPVVNFAAAFPLTSVVAVAGAMLPPPAVTADATPPPGVLFSNHAPTLRPI